MKSKIITIVAMLLCSSLQLFAQSAVSGIVKSGTDGQPLPGVVVTIGTDNARYAITDLDGKYSITPVKDG